MFRIIALLILTLLATFGMVVWFPGTNQTLAVVGGFPITFPMIFAIGLFGVGVKSTG